MVISKENMIMKKRNLLILIPVAVIATVVALGFMYDLSTLLAQLQQYLDRAPWYLFIVLILVLPLTGIPLSYLLVPVGLRFGPVQGTIILASILPLQLSLMYYLGRHPARKAVAWCMKNTGYSLPSLPEKKQRFYTLAVVVFPGLSFALKQYGLAFAGVPIRIYMAISLPVTFVLTVPFVLMGGSARQYNPLLFAGAVAGIILLLYLAGATSRMLHRKRLSPALHGEEDLAR